MRVLESTLQRVFQARQSVDSSSFFTVRECRDYFQPPAATGEPARFS